jgi:hypothetical protein
MRMSTSSLASATGCKGFSTIGNFTAQRCCYTSEGVSHFAFTFLTMATCSQ